MEVTTDFANLLQSFDLPALDDQPATIIGTWPDLTLAFTNKAWATFSSLNGGHRDRLQLGICIFDAIPEALLPFYREHFQEVIREDKPWEHEYECSSPEAFRLFHMLVYPVSHGQGLLMIHSLRRESAHDRLPPSLRGEYRDKDGFVHQCAHCRRTRRCDDHRVWDWIPDFVRTPQLNTSHGLCDVCYAYYYREERQVFPSPLSTVQ